MNTSFEPVFGSAENPFPIWMNCDLQPVIDQCTNTGKSEHDFYADLLPILINVAINARNILAEKGHVLNPDNRTNVLFAEEYEGSTSIVFDLRSLMNCNDGMCDMDIEEDGLRAIGQIRGNNWHNVSFVSAVDFAARRQRLHNTLQS